MTLTTQEIQFVLAVLDGKVNFHDRNNRNFAAQVENKLIKALQPKAVEEPPKEEKAEA